MRLRPAALGLAMLLLAACGDSASHVFEPASTTTTTTTALPVDTSSAVYPIDSMNVRFDGPTKVAKAFAVVVGFTDFVVGDYRGGDADSGEVDVRPKADGPATTVLVRRFGDGDWRALGSTTPSIQVQAPTAMATVASPLHVTGMSTAFEANVSVKVLQDGAAQPLGSHFVMGGSMGDMAPFEGDIAFTAPSAAYGSVVLFTESMEDGRLWEASVVRLRFAA